MVSVMLYPCIFCVALFVLCVACLTVCELFSEIYQYILNDLILL